MKIGRRNFLKTSLAYLAILSFSSIMGDPIVEAAANKVKEMVAGEEPVVHIIWLQGQTCSGDTVALLNATDPTLVDVLVGHLQGVPPVELDFQSTVMATWGIDHLTGNKGPIVEEWNSLRVIDEALTGRYDPYVLVVEGSVENEAEAKENGGFYCTIGETKDKIYYFEDYVKMLGERAAATVAIGTCAAFGGIPSGTPNPTKSRGVYDILGKEPVGALNLPVINVPGCPAAGDWQVKTLAHLLLTVKGILPVPELDEYHRPTFLYEYTVHQRCPRALFFASGVFSKEYGEPYCLLEGGCKGPISHCPITDTKWVEGVGACTSDGSPCIACADPSFPDGETSPFLKSTLPKERIPPVELPEIKPEIPVKEIGTALAILVAIGIGAGAYQKLKKRQRPQREPSIEESVTEGD